MKTTSKLLTIALSMVIATQAFCMSRLSRFAAKLPVRRALVRVALKPTTINPRLVTTTTAHLKAKAPVANAQARTVSTSAPARMQNSQQKEQSYNQNAFKSARARFALGGLAAITGAAMALYDQSSKAQGAAKETWNQVKTFDDHESITYISYSPDGKRAITACRWKPEIIVRDARTFEIIGKIQIPNPVNSSGLGNKEFDVLGIDFNSDGTKIIVFASGCTLAWDAKTFQLTHIVKDKVGLFWNPQFNKDKSALITGGEHDSGYCEIRDPKTLQIIARVGDGDRTISRAEFSPDGTKVICVKDIGDEISIWSTTPAFNIQCKKVGSIQSNFGVDKAAKFSPDGTKIVVLNSKSLSVWDAQNYKRLAVFPTLDEVNGYYEVKFSNDGKLLLAMDTHKLRVWDVATLKQVSQIDTVYKFSMSSDGTKILTSSYNGNVSIWDAQTFQEVAQYKVFLFFKKLNKDSDEKNF